MELVNNNISNAWIFIRAGYSSRVSKGILIYNEYTKNGVDSRLDTKFISHPIRALHKLSAA
jgi:hypothetical protein